MTVHCKLTGLVVAAAMIAGACTSTSTNAASPTSPAAPLGEVQTAATVEAIAAVPDTAHPSCSADVITTAVPSEFDGNGFDRYYELVMEDQVAMRYLFQPSLSGAQIEHVVRTTRWYLTDVPGSVWGADKSSVISQLAANNATMVIPNGSHVEGQDLGVRGQELYANEIAAPGSAWYVANDEDHRDATLEEVFHQVQDAGIGTTEPGALPAYQAALLEEAKMAKDDGRWATGADDWIADLAQEGSLAQEYIASVIDNYYGMWAHRSDGSGYYRDNTRAKVISGDPAGAALLGHFLGETIEAEAFIDPSFNGAFIMERSDDAAYGYKSQYLRGARLTGTNNSSIRGNGFDNTLRGNAADNTLDGGPGTDIAIYCQGAAEYDIAENADGSTTIAGPDGTDTLMNIEIVVFADSAWERP